MTEALAEYLALGPCQFTRGYVNPRNGYMTLSDRRYVHRVAMEAHLGVKLTTAQQVGHRCHDLAAAAGVCGGGACRHRRCVNPDHLVVQTSRENLAASPFTMAAKRRAQTHCKRGHPLSGDNLMIRTNGSRRCRECVRVRARALNARRRWQRVVDAVDAVFEESIAVERSR